MTTEELPPPDLGEVSPVSSTSSFVPVERVVLHAVQVIDENKRFSDTILDYVNQAAANDSIGNNYHIISVFGSQSTGKSTLLNKLFNTRFDVMDESNRQQTTKGIWMAYSPVVSSTKSGQHHENIFVMDVEGTDGRERGEDQDFERKAALFALSTSEVLIVNIWEHQIGLYQGANMGLLKTVFEVNLTLFGKSKLDGQGHKVLLLFVIRDHVGVTPKDNLAATLTQDIHNMWDTLNKPAELAALSFSDFFDISFHTIGHKVLQPDKFTEDVKLLGDRVVDNNNIEYLFKKEYHHHIPIDGWTMYAENCWDQIDNNKDLDLPTQQILVAKFKCDEISAQVYEEFVQRFDESLVKKVPSSHDDVDYQQLGLTFTDLRADTLENYDISASRYNQLVYESKRVALADKVNAKFQSVFDIYAKLLLEAVTKSFAAKLALGRKRLPGKDFGDGVANLHTDAVADFSSKAKLLSLDGDLDDREYVAKLQSSLEKLVSKQQLVELNSIVNKAVKKLGTGLGKSIVFEIGDLREETWDNILARFKSLSKESIAKYETADGYDFGLGTSAATNAHVVQRIGFRHWEKFHELIHKYISKDNLVTLLQDRFDDKFRYDENGLPRLYQNSTELENTYTAAKAYALKVLPILTLARLSDGTEILPDYDIFDKSLKAKFGGDITSTEVQVHEVDSDSDSDEEEDSHCFSEILSEQEKTQVLAKFKREVDARYVETKRSLIQHITQIPYYIYIIIVVLGWNEFVAVIRNPLFFTLLLLFGAGGYVMYQLNLLKPALVVAQRLLVETLDVVKDKLREILEVPTSEDHGHNLRKMAGAPEEEAETIELQDL